MSGPLSAALAGKALVGAKALRDGLSGYAFYYPLFMAWVWMIGGLWYYLRWENQDHRGAEAPPPTQNQPPASILIPCFNESDNIRDTLAYALASDYPEFEVIAIDDGSRDHTGEVLDQLARQDPRLRVVHLTANQGKAIALCAGAIAARHEFFICIDGDALLHPNAVAWMMAHLACEARVGAVTGNPRILNRSTLLGRLQVGEFSSIIGLMKRAQRIYGRIFTMSGVIAGFRRTALHRIGYWSPDMITEDIDISWRLQMDHWDIRYEPEALCYIYMPETFHGLWIQRLRWAQGGVEVLRKHGLGLLRWRRRRFWGVASEYLASLAWAYILLAVVLLYCLGGILPPALGIHSLVAQWNGAVLALTALAQFGLSMWIDRRYEPDRRLVRNYFWIIWYPLAFWLIALATSLVALPKVLLTQRGQRARWNSPDRGVREPEQCP